MRVAKICGAPPMSRVNPAKCVEEKLHTCLLQFRHSKKLYGNKQRIKMKSLEDICLCPVMYSYFYDGFISADLFPPSTYRPFKSANDYKKKYAIAQLFKSGAIIPLCTGLLFSCELSVHDMNGRRTEFQRTERIYRHQW